MLLRVRRNPNPAGQKLSIGCIPDETRSQHVISGGHENKCLPRGGDAKLAVFSAAKRVVPDRRVLLALAPIQLEEVFDPAKNILY